MNAEAEIPVSERINVTDSVSVIKRSYYSISWLATADVMKTRAEEIGGGKERPPAPMYDELRAYVLSAVTATAAFLEAHINELFEDAAEYLTNPTAKALRGLDRETQVRLAAVWPHVERRSVMDKYDVALDLAEADALDRGAETAHAVRDLLQVRNRFVHYRPTSIRDGVAQGNDKKLSDRLKSKLTLPAWDNHGEDLFPNQAICPDLARWAIQSAVQYTDAFAGRLVVSPSYDHVRPEWLG